MPFLLELRAIAGGPLGRREALAAAPTSRMIARYAFAGILDLAAGLALVMMISSKNNSSRMETPIIITLIVATILLLLPLFSAVGLAATAIAGDRAEDTLEALVLTPMDRREIVWAKLLGRTVPVRRFMIAAAPAFLACAEVPVLAIIYSSGISWTETNSDALVMVLALAVGAVVAAAAWLLIFMEAHCAAAIALYCSARISKPWLAAATAYALVFAPPLLLLLSCYCSWLALAYPFVLGPLLFDSLLKNFDAYALGEPMGGPAGSTLGPPPYRLPPPARRNTLVR